MTGTWSDTWTDLWGEPMTRKGIWVYVWQNPPAAGALDRYQGALVRAANGNGTTNPTGFDFAANYAAWVRAFGKDRVQPWTYVYPTSNGTTAANVLHEVAGDRAIYQCDLEDAVPPATIRAFCDRLHAAVPGCKIVFDSYPTRHQFINVNGTAGAATWDQAVHSFDVFCPQVYYASQRDDGWEREFAGKPIWPAFSPANWAAWEYFQANLDRYGVVNLWRYPFTDQWKGKLRFTEVDMSYENWTQAGKEDFWADFKRKLTGSNYTEPVFGHRFDDGALTPSELLGKYGAPSLAKSQLAEGIALAVQTAGVPATLTQADREAIAGLVVAQLQVDGEATISGTLAITPKPAP